MNMHISQFASNFRCKHCGKIQGTREWPASVDRVPFYSQDEPGNYMLKMNCPHCGKDWYVVWDDNPGLVQPFFFMQLWDAVYNLDIEFEKSI